MSSHPTTPGARAHTYDAIVVGSGISGGWAAKELCEAGLRTLVLERGRDVQHLRDYPTALANPWDLPHRGRLPRALAQANPIARKCYAFDEATCSMYTYNVDEANAVLDEAGYVDTNGDGVREKDGQELVIGHYYRAESPLSVQMAEYMLSDLAKVGIKVELNGLSSRL